MERLDEKKEYLIGMRSAGGAVYGVRLAAELLSRGMKVTLILPDRNPNEDNDLSQWIMQFKDKYKEDFAIIEEKAADSDILSGARPISGMVIIPCNMDILSDIAEDVTEGILRGAAGLIRRQHRELILVPEETPFTTEQLLSMLTLSKSGVKIVPAMPGFEYRPASLEDLIDYVTGKILKSLSL